MRVRKIRWKPEAKIVDKNWAAMLLMGAGFDWRGNSGEWRVFDPRTATTAHPTAPTQGAGTTGNPRAE